jgi:hypothetical protein
MRQARVPMLVALLAAMAALPATAEVYSVTLTNGSLFESRYLPRQATWDAGMMELATETGAWIALPKSLVQSITAMSETKGFGRVIDTTTIDLGFAPNDLPEVAVTVDNSAIALQEAMNRSYDIQQFSEPNQAGRGTSGGGLPIWGVAGGGGGGFTPPLPAPAPVPAPPPPPAAPAPPSGAGSSPQ